MLFWKGCPKYQNLNDKCFHFPLSFFLCAVLVPRRLTVPRETRSVPPVPGRHAVPKPQNVDTSRRLRNEKWHEEKEQKLPLGLACIRLTLESHHGSKSVVNDFNVYNRVP